MARLARPASGRGVMGAGMRRVEALFRKVDGEPRWRGSIARGEQVLDTPYQCRVPGAPLIRPSRLGVTQPP